jgi:hypothetical protein
MGVPANRDRVGRIRTVGVGVPKFSATENEEKITKKGFKKYFEKTFSEGEVVFPTLLAVRPSLVPCRGLPRSFRAMWEWFSHRRGGVAVDAFPVATPSVIAFSPIRTRAARSSPLDPSSRFMACGRISEVRESTGFCCAYIYEFFNFITTGISNRKSHNMCSCVILCI